MTGVERIAEAFESARASGRRAALMPYLMGGFPDLATSKRIGLAYAESGADLIELGVPFSDPLADGPVIHAAGTAALKAGATLPAVLEVGRAISEHVPVVVMCYANLILARGLERFADALARGGRERADRARPSARGGRAGARRVRRARAGPGAAGRADHAGGAPRAGSGRRPAGSCTRSR